MLMGYNDRVLKETRKKLRRDSTKAEQILWEEIRGKKLGMKFFRQYSVANYVLDFYCPKFKLAIELDGKYHDDKGVRKKDAVRTEFLNFQGIEVVRFQNWEVEKQLETVLKKIKTFCVPPLG